MRSDHGPNRREGRESDMRRRALAPEQRKAPWAQGPRLDGCTMYSATDTLESVGVGTAERKRERERPVLTQRITYHLR